MRSCNDIMRGRIRFQALLIVLFFAYLIGKLYCEQIRRHDYYYTEARNKYVTSKKLKGVRGEIFDMHGNLLAGNMPCQNVSVTPCNIKAQDDEKISRLIAETLGLDYEYVLKRVSLKTRTVKDESGKVLTLPLKYALIANNIHLEDARYLRQVLKKHSLARNVHFEDTFTRYYPKGTFLSNVVGITTRNQGSNRGEMGLEKRFEKQLRSDSGKKTYMRSLDGWQVGDKPLQEVSSHDGSNIFLTVVEPLQSILEDELDKAWEKFRPRAAYAVMIDPATGNVLAIAERPSFDPNDRKSLDNSAFKIRLISDIMEPGSIMKPLTVAGALECKAITPDTVIDCGNGTWYYNNRPLTDTHGYGRQDVTGVIRKSSNIGIAKIGLMMGEQNLYNSLRKFGFGSRTGLPLSPESSGIFHPVKRWDGQTITRLGIGYASACTPVQMARAYCALANNGKLPKLRLIDRTVDTESGKVTVMPPAEMQQIYPPEVIQQVVKMMIAVTEPGGTATRAAIPGYHVAGKTGTSHKVANGGYVGKYFASFVGFVPAEKPAFVLLVTVDEPKGAKFGGTVSAPVWKAMAERALKYMNIPPDVPQDESKKRH
ncbi:MAG: penicillin-binding protein 2 [Lentisphaerae bacterium]|nr:penicillin-binding protein 2 [Lentisphaerota bacterium]